MKKVVGHDLKKKGKSSRLAWSRNVLAVELGRLPASDRLRKCHGRKRTPFSLLDTQTPTHLDNMCSRIHFFHRLRAVGEDVIEKTPVRSATQEVLTHGHERSKVCNGVGREVMELGSEKVQETPEKMVRGKGETAVDMGMARRTHSPSRG